MASLLAIHMQTVDLPEGTSLTRQEYYDLLGLLGDHTMKLQSIYRSSRDGTTYSDVLRCVGGKTGLVFLIRKDQYVFGSFISAGIQPPDEPTSGHWYGCDVWDFSLAGHFPEPTKIDIDDKNQCVSVAGREGQVNAASVEIGGWLRLGREVGGDAPAADIRSCLQPAHPGPSCACGLHGGEG
ncbi:unnamed protein product [Vitrella brassicaformis CCMP3155]|uniref:TLDc domain-containing protein n=1 Tax=Vitrella brassicaformis (strain CCMP3155) TaxID=1169540 RepID=A0A0G4FI73_VITBC|nr:unnamed protein product [Vitrella brassicaformis CCMP3155]|eukprot:CEM12819.1 unnamed protein product [Vitrella brassicaformis CCMP3155]